MRYGVFHKSKSILIVYDIIKARNVHCPSCLYDIFVFDRGSVLNNLV